MMTVLSCGTAFATAWPASDSSDTSSIRTTSDSTSESASARSRFNVQSVTKMDGFLPLGAAEREAGVATSGERGLVRASSGPLRATLSRCRFRCTTAESMHIVHDSAGVRAAVARAGRPVRRTRCLQRVLVDALADRNRLQEAPARAEPARVAGSGRHRTTDRAVGGRTGRLPSGDPSDTVPPGHAARSDGGAPSERTY